MCKYQYFHDVDQQRLTGLLGFADDLPDLANGLSGRALAALLSSSSACLALMLAIEGSSNPRMISEVSS